MDISPTTRWISDLSGSNESYGRVRYESEGIFTFYRLEEKLELHKVKIFFKPRPKWSQSEPKSMSLCVRVEGCPLIRLKPT